ncbi:SDR family oxidoreductase [Streptomyces griseoviridis]|jgi:NAD(P)-dependent dehydrogenase (short-subunit alcohol dehydrogenase family)|uniref:NAD(P)-dependent dehydrogenase (Short-subunit alcohol dehydrogenase family) n=3 Tax=Streptomyces TaxID=1883 RepID=A0ABT9LFU2_STRGD|nr:MULTISPECIES: SDR family oxidoreductase [Streptomyces]MDP9682583.1 NAD(P)-dependent dehydrogenase (short-subunit alcohol dehydrogenase family) [Streptomyces griseoviridis]GGS28454.1 short-chain dehydrogenase [Streptomyces niveoruber]GGS80324.1 short-chain dehydrogenase [Streptomyces griseoviridis]GGU20072.1 short-chain dehydrogenase [Streptomyces daghestanicus]GHI32195.1 short-chain dehydrogenase [Streptomyces daghestanicus]
MSAYDGKRVVITGGGSGIGFATAELLVRAGSRVVITGRDEQKLDAALRRLGAGAAAVRGDVASLADLDVLAERVRAELGAVDALFVNAGVTSASPFEETTEAMFDASFAVNVKGAFFTVQKLAPLLAPGAGVVLTTSVANVMGLAETSVYAAGKAALRSLARSLSRELLPRGVRVNAVSPGPVDTGILEGAMGAEAAARFKADRVAENPMGRFGTPEEIARAVAFLAFDATYTTGAELVVDGGVTQL